MHTKVGIRFSFWHLLLGFLESSVLIWESMRHFAGLFFSAQTNMGNLKKTVVTELYFIFYVHWPPLYTLNKTDDKAESNLK